MTRGFALVIATLLATVLAAGAPAQDLPLGTVIDDVKSASDASQSYALYVPSTYKPERPSSLLLAFHAGGRGKAMVEKYRAAAEEYGYIVAGSNTSRNGPWAVSMAAVKAMGTDLPARFAIDPKRIYMTGLSGGARVALQVALAPGTGIAGVVASSAGYPDSQPRAAVPFAIFSTAGTEDFNYIEMRRLDRKLTSPHFLAVFEGGHSLPTDDVAMDAIEWLEVQAMRSGLRSRDEALIGRWFDKRMRQIDASSNPATTVYLLEAVTADFKDLRDVTAASARLKQMSSQSDVKKAISREKSADDEEWRTIGEVFDLEARLTDRDARPDAISRLGGRLAQLSRAAGAAADSPQRRQARRLLGVVAAGVRERSQDPEYLKLVQQYARPTRP